MVGRQELDLLNHHRQALVVESDLNRFAFRSEWNNLRASLTRFDAVVGGVRRVAPWLLPLAPLAGWYAARAARRRVAGGSLVSALRWIPQALALWRMFADSRGKPPR